RWSGPAWCRSAAGRAVGWRSRFSEWSTTAIEDDAGTWDNCQHEGIIVSAVATPATRHRRAWDSLPENRTGHRHSTRVDLALGRRQAKSPPRPGGQACCLLRAGAAAETKG